MRFLLLLLIVDISLFADYLVTIPQGNNENYYCASDYYYSGGNLNYISSATGQTFTVSKSTVSTGYDFNSTNGVCSKYSYLQYSGLTFEDWNALYALAGLMVALTFLLSASQILTRIGGR